MPTTKPRTEATRNLTPAEKAKFVLFFERNDCDYEKFRLAARREWNLRDSNLPAKQTLKDWRAQLLETGSLERRPYHRER